MSSNNVLYLSDLINAPLDYLNTPNEANQKHHHYTALGVLKAGIDRIL